MTRIPTDRSVNCSQFYSHKKVSAIAARDVILTVRCPGMLYTCWARHNLQRIIMTTDLTNIPPDFQVLASGIVGPDGPAIGADGELYLISTEDAAIVRVSSDGDITQVAKTEGRPNGLAFNAAGEMFIADAGLKAILRVGADGKVETFVDEYEGTTLGGPNDLCFLPNGDLLFTDPIRRPLPDPAISPIYRVSPDGKVSVFAMDLAYPNGIAVSTDRKSVYVTESRAHRLVSFMIDETGRVQGQTLIRRFREPGNPDGIAVDVEGNILLSLPVIRAIAYVSASGELLDLFHVPDWAPANLAFGGSDMKTVFVCGSAQSAIYQFRHPVPGAPLL